MKVDDGGFCVRVCIQSRVKDADEPLVAARVEVAVGEKRVWSACGIGRREGQHAPSVWRKGQAGCTVCVGRHDEFVGVLAHRERARVGARKREVGGDEQATREGGSFAGRFW